jgi:predicted O-methyltransferase YrrM
MSDYKFTQDWFAWAPAVWEQFKPILPDRKNFLEIGSYEGRSTVWTVEHMMEDDGEIVAIDTWEGGEEHAVIGEKMNVVEANFDHNIKILSEKHPTRTVSKIKALSTHGLADEIMIRDNYYDFIYIDGSHIAKDVLTDACMAWPLLKSGGIIVFDDYMWGDPRDILHRPKIAIDSFVNVFAEHLEVVAAGYQLAVRKK